jgi:hypothetical protein
MLGTNMENHLALFSSIEISRIGIEAVDINGNVAYPPGAEAARIEFEYRSANGLEWQLAHIAIMTVKYPGSDGRLICDLPEDVR